MAKKSKNFKQEIQSMESGLHQLEGIVRNCKDKRKQDKALKQITLQKERMVWLRRGYNLRDNEITEQKAIPIKVNFETGKQLDLQGKKAVLSDG